MTSVYAEEKGPSTLEYGITTYGIFNYATNGAANDGKIYASEDSSGYYAGWSGQGGGIGLGLSAMWHGYIGIDVQMLYSSHTVSGSFSDPDGGPLDFEYTLTQFDVPIMLKAAYPNRIITPSVSMGAVLRKDFTTISDGSLSGGNADVLDAAGFSKEHWLTRFGAGFEKTLPLEGHDLRLSFNIMINYDGHIADGFDTDEKTQICFPDENVDVQETTCTFVPEYGTIWRTDVMLGAGYHF